MANRSTFHVKDDFRAGSPITAVPASWFNAVASFLNNLLGGRGIKIEKNAAGASFVELDGETVADLVAATSLSDVAPPEDSESGSSGSGSKAARADHSHPLHIGKTSTTYAAGNHNHDEKYAAKNHSHADYAPVSHQHNASDIIGFNPGSGSIDEVPAHTHPTSQIIGLGNAATRNVGTTSGTVAAGDHTHDDDYLAPADLLGGASNTGSILTTANVCPAGEVVPCGDNHYIPPANHRHRPQYIVSSASFSGAKAVGWLDAAIGDNSDLISVISPSSQDTGVVYVADGVVSYRGIGTAANQLAAGNHTHSMSNITDAATVVRTTGTQTVSGAKTFSDLRILDGTYDGTTYGNLSFWVASYRSGLIRSDATNKRLQIININPENGTWLATATLSAVSFYMALSGTKNAVEANFAGGYVNIKRADGEATLYLTMVNESGSNTSQVYIRVLAGNIMRLIATGGVIRYSHPAATDLTDNSQAALQVATCGWVNSKGFAKQTDLDTVAAIANGRAVLDYDSNPITPRLYYSNADCTATNSSSRGSSGKAAMSDHIHVLPASLLTTENKQTIPETARKRFMNGAIELGGTGYTCIWANKGDARIGRVAFQRNGNTGDWAGIDMMNGTNPESRILTFPRTGRAEFRFHVSPYVGTLALGVNDLGHGYLQLASGTNPPKVETNNVSITLSTPGTNGHAYLTKHPADTNVADTADTTNAALQIATCAWVNSKVQAQLPEGAGTVNIDGSTSSANTATWTAGGENKVVVRKLMRHYFEKTSTSSKLYAFYRDYTYDPFGRLYSISKETRETVFETVHMKWGV